MRWNGRFAAAGWSRRWHCGRPAGHHGGKGQVPLVMEIGAVMGQGAKESPDKHCTRETTTKVHNVCKIWEVARQKEEDRCLRGWDCS